MIVGAVFVARTTDVSKGMTMGVLLIIVMAVIVAIAAILIMSTQTDFISNAAAYMGNLLTIKAP